MFFGLIPFGVPVVAAASLGGSDVCPAGRLVERGDELRRLGNSLDELGRDVVAPSPVWYSAPSLGPIELRESMRRRADRRPIRAPPDDLGC